MTIGLFARGQRVPNPVEPRATEKRWFRRLSTTGDDDRLVARRGHTEISERNFRARVRGWAATFEPRANAAIAIFQPDGVEFAAALLGAWYANKTVLLPGDTRPATCHALKAMGVAFAGGFTDEWNPIPPPGDGEAAQPFTPLDANETELVVYTSGSSGAPQLLSKKLGQLLAEVETLEQLFGMQLGESAVLSTVSHQHIYGLLFKIFWPLTAGRSFVSESISYPEEIVAHLAVRRTAIVSGPAHLKRLPESLNWAAARAGAAMVFSSGGPLPLASVNSVEALFGITPVEVYGSTETGGVAWRQRVGGVEQPWTPMPRVMVREDEGGLVVRSPHLPDDQWHVVADRVLFDSDDTFMLRGRADRIAKIEGTRVSLRAIEEALMRSALVSDASAVVLEIGRDELGAVVVPSQSGWALMRQHGAAILRHRLDSLLAETAERIACPRRWRWLDAIPVNDVGKRTAAGLSELFAPHALVKPAVHLLERTGVRVLAELYVSPHLNCFDGHFAGLAVLPGVAQLDWAVELGSEYFGIKSSFERLEAVKFHRVYQPGHLMSVELNWRPERDQLSFRFSSSEGQHSSGRILFTR